MSKRIKTKPQPEPVVTREEMEALVGDIARLTTYKRRTTALMDKRITEIRSEYEDQLAGVEQELAAKAEAVRRWAEANAAEFGKLKSLDLLHGVIGWRVGNPTLKTLAGWTWDRVLERLKSAAGYAGFIRTKEEVDKASILAQRDTLLPDDLRQMGLRVVQEEAFFVEPKLTDVDNKLAA